MRIVMFYHSLLSDWNHGNAHFLRGVVGELIDRGHSVKVYEPEDGWSLSNLVKDYGYGAIEGFRKAYPGLESASYSLELLDLDVILEDADLVMVHEWNDPRLVKWIGQHRSVKASYALLFHDTHHRAVTEPEQMRRYDLGNFDGVLGFGEVLRRLYVSRGWARRAWAWHEAADVRVFRPPSSANHRWKKDLVWVGNWGDEERTAELRDFVVRPAMELGLETEFYGVRYPERARAELIESGIAYRGWIANYRVPEIFSHFNFTVHVPRRPYTRALPGIPTIRVYEALACGIPLISSRWDDCEELFGGDEFLMAGNGDEMREHMRLLLNEPALGRELAQKGLQTVLERHTCAHRVDELLKIIGDLGITVEQPGRTVVRMKTIGAGLERAGERYERGEY